MPTSLTIYDNFGRSGPDQAPPWTDTMPAPTEETNVFPFDNSYARLPERFYARLPPTPVAAPSLIRINEALARELGLDPAFLASAEGVEVLAGNRIAPGSEPIATAYAGHQFGGF